MNARNSLNWTRGLLAAAAAIALSAPAFAEEAEQELDEELIEEIIVIGDRPDTPQEIAMRERLEIVLEELDNIDDVEAREDSTRPTRFEISLGYDLDEEVSQLVEAERHLLPMDIVQPASIIRVGF